MRKFLAPCRPTVTAESRVAEGGAQPVSLLVVETLNGTAPNKTDQISQISLGLCL